MLAGRGGTEKNSKATNNRRRKLFRHNTLLTLVSILINGKMIFCLLHSKRTFHLVDIQGSKALFSLGPNKTMHVEYFGKRITRDDQGLGTENNSSSALFLTIIL
eukprot:scaffold103408_cov67-Attheya_sp.AAC.1